MNEKMTEPDTEPREPEDVAREKAAREKAQEERGCFCGYWTGTELLHPHVKCACAEAVRKRQEGHEAMTSLRKREAEKKAQWRAEWAAEQA